VQLAKPILAGLILLALLVLWIAYGVYVSMSVPEARYEVLETLENDVEIRAYPGEVWATNVAADQNKAFGPLFKYISGDNNKSEKIEMTAPVVIMKTEKGQFMAFVMPERFDINSIPMPSSSDVKIELIKARKLAAIRFSNYVTQENYEKHQALLTKTLESHGISMIGKPLLMQYNDPWTPPFMRRNEVAIQVDQ